MCQMSDNHLTREEARMEQLDKENPLHWLDKVVDFNPEDYAE